jgi:uncharacterized protein YhfF
MDPALRDILEAAFPGQSARHFAPMIIGGAEEGSEPGAEAILSGRKTLTSSPFWDYPDGRIPFVGALCVLLGGARRPRAIVETVRVEVMPFSAITDDLARAYGEGGMTAAWWRREIGAWYRDSAARHGATFTEDTPIIWEWIAVARRL